MLRDGTMRSARRGSSSSCCILIWGSAALIQTPAEAQSCLLHTGYAGGMVSPYTSSCENNAFRDSDGCETTGCKARVDRNTLICCTSVCCSNAGAHVSKTIAPTPNPSTKASWPGCSTSAVTITSVPNIKPVHAGKHTQMADKSECTP